MSARSVKLGALAVFILLSLLGEVSCIRLIVFAAHAQIAEAAVTRFERVHTKSGWADQAVYAYRDHTGRQWEGRVLESSPGIGVGQKFSIVYDRNEPSFSISSTMWWVKVGPILGGVVFAFLTIGLSKIAVDVAKTA